MLYKIRNFITLATIYLVQNFSMFAAPTTGTVEIRQYNGTGWVPIQVAPVNSSVFGLSGAGVPQFTAGGSVASLSLTGTAGGGFIDALFQSSNPTPPAANHSLLFIDSIGNLAYQGSGGGAKIASFQSAGLSANRIFVLPDISDTLVTLTATQTLTNKSVDHINIAGTAGAGYIDFTQQASGPATPASFHSFLYADTLNQLSYSYVASATNRLVTFAPTVETLSPYSLPATGGTLQTLAILSNRLDAFAATTSAQLATKISDETGSGSLVFATAPTFAGTTQSGTNTAKFGVTANATIGVSADTTAGITTFTAASAGEHLFARAGQKNLFVNNNTNISGVFDASATGGNGFYLTNSNSSVIQSAGSTSLVIAGGASVTLTGGTGNMTLTAGTGNSRTMALQTTTSGGVATTFLSADDSQNSLFGGNAQIPSTGLFFFANRSVIRSSADGILVLHNNAQNSFDRLNFGGITNAFPAIKRSSAVLQARLADDSAYADMDADDFTAQTGGFITQTIGKTLSVKSGSNAKAGTFTLTAGAATVANTSVTANSVVMMTLKTLSGTITTEIFVATITPSTGFTVAGAATNNSTYNYIILEVN